MLRNIILITMCLNILALFFAGVIYIDAQEEKERPAHVLFSPMEVKDLKEKAKERYDRIKAQKTTVDIAVYRLNNLYGAAEFAKKVDISFTIGKDKVEILGCTSKKGVLTLEKEGRNFVVVTVKESHANGLIYSGKKVYAVEPLGDFVVAICEIDQSKFPKD